MHAIELIEVEGELGFVIPDEMLKKLNLKLGDELGVTELERGVLLTPIHKALEPSVSARADE